MKKKKVKITEDQFRKEYTKAVKMYWGLEFNDMDLSDDYIKECAEEGILPEKEALRQGKGRGLTRMDKFDVTGGWGVTGAWKKY